MRQARPKADLGGDTNTGTRHQAPGDWWRGSTEWGQALTEWGRGSRHAPGLQGPGGGRTKYLRKMRRTERWDRESSAAWEEPPLQNLERNAGRKDAP